MNVLSSNLPAGTEGYDENISSGSGSSRLDLNPENPIHKEEVLTTRLRYSAHVLLLLSKKYTIFVPSSSGPRSRRKSNLLLSLDLKYKNTTILRNIVKYVSWHGVKFQEA